ncbi:carbon storage regulator [Clostridium sporogenes]|uniref:carbon storage regulator n=1 Tax=Clostridium sporogenes TaxID=1509 RepID=UPI0029007184|nr:carbon storage regulator [Clostridium botulinum]
MLVLGIHTGEEINVGADIKLTFIKVKENTVRIAIDAPKEVPILRAGVQDKEKAP